MREDTKVVGVREEDAMDRAGWRKLFTVATPKREKLKRKGDVQTYKMFCYHQTLVHTFLIF